MVVGFTGCAKKILLESTILEGAAVITDDSNNKYIVKNATSINGKAIDINEKSCSNDHYIDIVSGNNYCDNSNENQDKCYYSKYGVINLTVEKKESITTYLTNSDLEKEEITAKDIIEIYDRIKKENKVLEKK